MIRPVLHLIVYGVPGTAGSKDGTPIYAGRGEDRTFTGKVAVHESPSPVKTSWLDAVVSAASKAIRCQCDDLGCRKLLPGWPLDEAVVAAMAFTVRKPKSAPKTIVTYPSGRPDVLKMARATEDHLTAAGCWPDDARIVEYGRLVKCYPGEDPDALDVPGVRIVLWRRRDLPVAAGAEPALRAISARIARPREGTLF